jgi:sugar lactone lactonase YvrE
MPGRYSLTSPESNKRYEIIRSNSIPTGVLLANRGSGNSTQFTFGSSTDGGPYFVSVKDATGAVQQSFYVYSPEATIIFPAGDWYVTIAKPGEPGFGFSVRADAAGQLEKLDRVGLVNRADWFMDTVVFASKTSPFTYNTGPAQLAFQAGNSPQYIVQIRDPETGTIGSYLTTQNMIEVPVDPGMFEWRVFAISQQSIYYPELVSNLSTIEGGWSPFLQRSADTRPPISLSVPGGWSSYAVKDPTGKLVGAANGESWIDFSQLPKGRYSVVGTTAAGLTREEVVISPEIEGGVVVVRTLSSGSFEFRFAQTSSANPVYVTVKDASGADVSAGYYYGQPIRLDLPNGKYAVSVSSAQAAFTFNLGIAQNALESVNAVRTVDGPDWYLGAVKKAGSFGPVTTNAGTAHFSFDPTVADKFVVQIRDPNTLNVGSYLTNRDGLSLTLGTGAFEWRAFGVPEQAITDPSIGLRLSALAGGWTGFSQVDETPTIDYILGLEPDQIKNVDQLALNYPGDAVRLSDGSIVISNTYASTIERVYPDGRVERLAGGNRVGYTEQGIGKAVLLNRTGQIFDNENGTVFFVDSQNFVVREINLGTGVVRTILGDKSNLSPTIVDGQITGLGDIYSIGRDSRGQPFVTAAETIIVGDRVQSGETKFLRHNDIGRWYFWNHDRSSLSPGTQFIDVLFHDDVVSVIATDSTTKRYLQYNESGALLANVEIGSPFGAGLVKHPTTGELLIGNHTAIMRLNHRTLAMSPFPFPDPLANVSYMEVDGTHLIITDSDRWRVYDYDLISGNITAKYGQFSTTSNVIVDMEVMNGSLLMLDNLTPRILGYEQGKIRSITGNGIQSPSNQSGQSATDTLFFPNAIAAGADGSIYFVDANHRISKIAPDQTVSAFAGSITSGYSGDGGLAKNARFQSIYGLDVAADGSVYVADSFNHAIRKISPDGTVSTIVGNGLAQIAWMAEEGQSALNTPNRVLVTDTGRIFISDSWNNRVVELMPDGRLLATAGAGKFTTYQGGGDFSGDGEDAASAGLNTPTGLAFYEADGTLFITDTFNNRIRYVDSAGNIHTLIGGDRGYAFGELLNLPSDIALVGDDLYVADTGNALVLKLVGVDRTGDDFANSLDIGKAITRARFNTRSEYVAADDVDFYNLAGFADGVITITADGSGLTLDFSNGSDAYYGKIVLNAGQSVEIDADDRNFLIVSASTKQKYTMSFSQTSALFAMKNAAKLPELAVADESTYDRRIPLMVQAMTSFIDGHGHSVTKYSEPAPTYDFFA